MLNSVRVFRWVAGLIAVLLWTGGTAWANTINVAGGGALTFSAFFNEVRCSNSDNPHFEADYNEYTNFVWSGGTISNPTAVATYNGGDFAACGIPKGASPTNLTLNLPNGCFITFNATVPSTAQAVLSSPSCYGVQGYVNPKYIVVGVTYAPPGPSGNTWVTYTNSNSVGTTKGVSNSFTSGTSTTTTLSAGFMYKVIGGKVSQSTINSASQATSSTSSVTTTVQINQGEQLFGTVDYFNPVNHDYDVIWLWLNAAVVFTVAPGTASWNGYGFDATDQPGLDIIGVQLGYLNGHFGAMPTDKQVALNRTWASNMVFPTGSGPAINSTDLAAIAAEDPFNDSTYGMNSIGFTPPSPETPDHRFTLSLCSQTPGSGFESFEYVQAAPSQTPSIFNCALSYSTVSSQAASVTNSQSQEVDFDASFSGSIFFVTLSAELKTTNTLSFSTGSQTSSTNTTSSSASFSVQGPPCGNVSSGVGPCVPVYDAAGNQPTQFDVYQDNRYGTFMFAPVHFY